MGFAYALPILRIDNSDIARDQREYNSMIHEYRFLLRYYKKRGDIMKRFTASTVKGLAAALALAGAATAHAQSYPSRDITFIVPYGTGAATDPISRAFCMQLEKILGSKVNVENKPGGSGTIGDGVIVRSKPDGYTIGLGTNTSLSYQPLVNSGLAYKTADDYQPIVKLGDVPTTLFVRADAPWKTFAEFIADAKKNPGKMRASVSGLGTTVDLGIHQLNKAAGVKIATVPMSGGGGEALVALLGGRVEVNSSTGVGAAGFVKAGKIRPLAVFSKTRYDFFPTATPVFEAGYDVAPIMLSLYVIAPNNMPKEVKDKLVAASQQAVGSEEFIKFAKTEGYMVDPKGADAAKAELVQYSKTFSELIKFIEHK
jgi:tripartite-type tricarboxylate transporter receptor subunit TctC